MIVLIDNYDSFTYNLVQRLGEIDPGIDLQVVRNDQITVEEIEARNPSHIIISPGPCTPREAGISNDIVARFAPRVPCWGSAWATSASATPSARRSSAPTGSCTARPRGSTTTARESIGTCPTRSRRPATIAWSSSPTPSPTSSKVVAWTDQGEIMGVRHKIYPLEGVQFHPESFLTLEGIKLLKNFLEP